MHGCGGKKSASGDVFEELCQRRLKQAGGRAPERVQCVLYSKECCAAIEAAYSFAGKGNDGNLRSDLMFYSVERGVC